MRLWGLTFITTLLFSFTGDHSEYPQGDFIWPIKHAVKVSGTFGELRPNHFHAGIDLKSNRGGTGDKLIAAAEGYVSRIKVQEAGYGNALYISHPNGYTTVYAHMQRFPDSIAAYVKSQQYLKESFEVDLYPRHDQFKFAQGEYIGDMGSTGSSQGPHLHFEVRDSRTEMAVNPLLFGLKIPDRKAPRFHQLKIYGFGVGGQQLDEKTYKLRAVSGKYRVSGDTIYCSTPNFGIAVKAFDHHDNVSNWNGVFGVKLMIDDSLYYHYEMDRFSFDETRYINALLDYPERVRKKSYYYRCFGLPGNALSMLEHNSTLGIIDFESKPCRKIRVEVYDVDGNQTYSEFWVQAAAANLNSELPNHQYFLPHNESNLIQGEAFALYFPERALYQDLYLQLSHSADRSYGHYSDVLHIQDYLTPVHRYFDVALRPHKAMTEEERAHAFIAYCSRNGSITNYGGEWQENGLLLAKSNQFGNFAILVDRTPPRIENLSLRSDMRGRSTMAFKISDNLSTSRSIKGLQYRATIDGQWVLMEFDKKSKRLKHRLDRDIAKGEHEFRLVVTDAVGNETVYERTFRK